MPRDASPAFVGRQAELEQLGAAWQCAVIGETKVVLIGGDAGMGKTRLVREFVARGTGGGLIATGGCVPVAGGSIPFAPFVDLLRELAMMAPARASQTIAPVDLQPAVRAELGRLVPALRTTDPFPTLGDDSLARPRLFAAVRSLLSGVAATTPVLLVVEDLHWADGSSLDLLGYLIRSLRSDRVLVIATYRTDELHRRHPLRPWTTEIGRLDGVEHLKLGQLETADLRREIDELLGPDADQRLVDRIVERSEGNPLFATELVAFARERPDARGLPETLLAGFLHRLERLGPDALLAARHVSAIGRPASDSFLRASTELSVDRLAAALREALDARVLAEVSDRDGRYEPRHALLGEAVLDDLLPGERTALHGRLADLLEAGADDEGVGEREPARIAAEIAHHRWQTRELDRAVAASVRAAVAAARAHAFAEADGQWTRALERWPSRIAAEVAGFDHAAALVSAAEAAAGLGDHRRAANLADQALARIHSHMDPLRAAEVHRRLIWYQLHDDWPSAVVHSGQAVRLIPPGDPPPAAARILADRAVVVALRLHTDRAEPLARSALALAQRHQRPDAEMQALQALGNCLVNRSEHAAAIAVLRQAYDLAHRIGDAEGLMNTALALGWSLNDAGQSEAALEHCDRADDRFRELGLELRYGTEMLHHRLWALLRLGRWAELQAVAENTLAAKPDSVDGCGALALLRVRQDRLDDARHLAALIGSAEEISDIEPIGWDLDAWCAIALAEGSWTRARAVVAATFERVPVRVRGATPDLRRFVLYGLLAETEIALAARARRDAAAEAEALRIGEELARWARNLARVVTARGDLLATRTLADTALAAALFTRIERRPDPEAWRPALQGYEALGHRFDIARTRRWLGEAILESGGSRAEAASELTLAADEAVALGATVLEREIRDLARRGRVELRSRRDGDAQGARRWAPGDTPPRPMAAGRRSPASHTLVEPLTPREREVLGYLAAGWTNRRIGEALFISDKTVSVHVSNLLGKLGAANRAEAALIGDRLGLVPPEVRPA